MSEMAETRSKPGCSMTPVLCRRRCSDHYPLSRLPAAVEPKPRRHTDRRLAVADTTADGTARRSTTRHRSVVFLCFKCYICSFVPCFGHTVSEMLRLQESQTATSPTVVAFAFLYFSVFRKEI